MIRRSLFMTAALTAWALAASPAQAQATATVTYSPQVTPAPLAPTLSPVPLSPVPLLELEPLPGAGAGTSWPLPAATTPKPTTAPATAGAAGSQNRAYRPGDPYAAEQGYLSAARLAGPSGLWLERGLQAAPVTVAVLDTGYTPSPELGSRAQGGYDFVSGAARAGDGDGWDADARGVGPLAFHGEAVAHLIGAAHDRQGMAGINPAARIVQVRVADTAGKIEVNDLVAGLRWAAGLPVKGASVPRNPSPARIINLSLFVDWIPATGCDPRVARAVREVTAAGALVVVGAGNEDRDAGLLSPAGCAGALSVTSTDAGQRRSSYANWGGAVALAAPGGTTAHGLLVSSALDSAGRAAPLHRLERSGTSFAAPQVSGVASLLLGARPDLSPAQLRAALTESATPFARPCDPDPRKSCGAGELNAAAAFRWLDRHPVSRPTPAAPAKLNP